MTPHERPVGAFVLSLVGGILIVAGGLVFVAIRVFPFAFAFLSVLFGILVLVGATMLYVRPRRHALWGTLIIASSAASIVGFGGFVAGLVLGVLGGALAIGGKDAPTGPTHASGPYGVPVTPFRLCMGCGRWIPWAYNVCPLCGTVAPTAASTPSPAAIPTVPATPAAIRAACPTCQADAEWLPAVGRWYCPAERRYF